MVFAILFRTTIDSFDITSTDPETWPGAHTINNFLHEYSFYVNPSIQTNPQTADWGSSLVVHQVKQLALPLLWHIPGLCPPHKK